MNRFLLVAFLISFHAHTTEVQPYVQTNISEPKIDLKKSAYLGDIIISKKEGMYKQCITPKESYMGTYSGSNVRYLANEMMCKDRISDELYQPKYINYTYANDSWPVRWKKKGNKSSLCAKVWGGFGYCVKKLSEDSVKEGLEFQESSSQFIELVSIAGNKIKFIYSESSPSEPTITREFVVDLNEGNIAAYKGAIIEILSKTNIGIDYIIKRDFK